MCRHAQEASNRASLLGADRSPIRMTRPSLDLAILRQVDLGRDFESEQGSIPVEAIVETGTAWRAPIFFASYIARRLVGISVGIGSNRRRKLVYIQMVMAVVEYRPGAPPSCEALVSRE
jgi:hypothetical protein